MKALVTGCAGFIGAHLTERLLANRWSVIGIDSLAPTYDTIGRQYAVSRLASRSGFEFIEGDLNRMDLSELVSPVDVVFHLSARPGVRASWRDFEQVSSANILATQRVLDVIAQFPSTRLVFASSSSVYGQAQQYPVSESSVLAPISPYGVTKAACEALLSAYASQFELNLTSLRYFTVYGPRQRSDMAFTRWIRAALRGETLHIYGDGQAIRDFTFVDDVVEATLLAASSKSFGHHVYNVAGGTPVSVNDVLKLLRSLVDQDLSVEHTNRAKGDPARTGGDTRLIHDELGWQPHVELKDGLAAQVEWVRRSSQMD